MERGLHRVSLKFLSGYDQHIHVRKLPNCERKKHPMRLEDSVLSAHTGLGILPVPTSQTGKVVIHREVGRALRSFVTQQVRNHQSPTEWRRAGDECGFRERITSY